MHNYEHIKFIGSGSFGKVDLVRNIKEDREYVIKKIQTRDLTDKDRENIKNEVRLLTEGRNSAEAATPEHRGLQGQLHRRGQPQHCDVLLRRR